MHIQIVNFTLAGLTEAEYVQACETTFAAAFRDAMNEDFNTPLALASMFELASELNRTRSPESAALLRGLGATLGVLQQDARSYLQGGAGQDDTAIEAAIAARNSAKAAKNFAEADRIRRELREQGVLLKDTPQGTTWVKA